MSANTSIQWTNATWNPVRGCSRVSHGCDSCYAMSIAHRFSGPGRPYEGLTRIGTRGVDWAGLARLIPKALAEPLHWRKPRRIFVNSMSDLFHESLTNEEIAAVFGVMGACPQHTFQVLTKRAKRMREWFEWIASTWWALEPMHATVPPDANVVLVHLPNEEAFQIEGRTYGDDFAPPWPLPNVWLGVSAEDQQRADERIPDLLETPAAIRFVSVEPQIGPVSIHSGLLGCKGNLAESFGNPHIHWVIQGGESGRNARPFDVDWARWLRDDCREAGAAYFLKQLGAHPVEAHPDQSGAVEEPIMRALKLRDSHGGDWDEWPEDLRVREFPAVKP